MIIVLGKVDMHKRFQSGGLEILRFAQNDNAGVPRFFASLRMTILQVILNGNNL